MLEFVGCKNLRIEDVRIENAPGWTLRPINCDQVFIRGITIKNPVIGPEYRRHRSHRVPERIHLGLPDRHRR